MVQIGGGKGKKGKKQKKVIEYEDAFTIDINVIRKFGLILVSVPTVPEELDKKIKEIEDKQKWYEDNGKDKLAEQILELKRLNEEAEKEEEKEVEDPERETRGGRGRGGYKGGRGERGGRGGRGRPEFRVRSEFEGDDDEEFLPTTTKVVKKPKQSKADLVIDDDNYPTL